MTTESAIAKTIELIDCNDGCIDYLKRKIKQLVESGGIDPERFEDNFLLPKILFTAALSQAADQYMPLDKQGKKDVKNLLHF